VKVYRAKVMENVF